MEKQTSQNQKRCLPISDKNIAEKKKKKTEEQPEEMEKKSTIDDDFFPSQDPTRNLHTIYTGSSSSVVDNVSE